MKKLGKLLFALILCFSIVGCGESKDTKDSAEITKAFKEISYETKAVKEDGVDTLSFIKDDKGMTNQFISYFEDNKLHSIAYLSSPTDSKNYDDLTIGFIYVSDNIDEKDKEVVKINKDVVKTAETILGKVDLSLDEFIKYVEDIHKEKS